MTVIIVEAVPPRLRGQLTRWFLEPSTGVFVGSVSRQVADLVWQLTCSEVRTGGAVFIRSAANEQGFTIETWGETRRVVEDCEGLWLIRVPSGRTRRGAEDPAF